MGWRNASIHPDVRIGHVHLKVADLDRALAFYCGVLGFQLTQFYGRAAAFISAGGYHHHIGLNTWQSRGGRPAPAGSAGLRYFTIHLPDSAALDPVVARLDAAGIPYHEENGGLTLSDPFDNRIVLMTP